MILHFIAMFQTFYDDADYKNQISLTSSHLIYVKEKGFIKAASVNVGDHLQIYSEKTKRLTDFKVSRINYELKRGYIAPLTNQGTLLVNGVHASCYAEINSHYLADVAMTPLKLWNILVNLFDYERSKDETSINTYADAIYKLAVTMVPSIFV